jgi:hypothetical protein
MQEFRELLLEEMLADPIVRALMAADGVDPEELKTFCARQQDLVETVRFDGRFSRSASVAASSPAMTGD